MAADMLSPYRNAIGSQLPNAVLVHDQFLVIGYLTKVLEKVRKKEHWELKNQGDRVALWEYQQLLSASNHECSGGRADLQN